MTNQVPSMYTSVVIDKQYRIIKYFKDKKFVFVLVKKDAMAPFNIRLLILPSNYSSLVWGIINPFFPGENDSLESLSITGKPARHPSWTIDVNFQGKSRLYDIVDECALLVIPESRYDSIPTLYVKEFSYMVGIAANQIEMCKINEMQPHINKIKIVIAVFGNLSTIIPNDVQRFIAHILTELIRLDAALYIRSKVK